MMKFDNQDRDYQMPRASPITQRDEYGYTEEENLRMMDDVASKYIRIPKVVDSRITRYSGRDRACKTFI